MNMWSLGFMSGMVGTSEILVVLFVILLLFGAKRLPELARSLGRSLSEFKKGRDDEHQKPKGDVTKSDSESDADPSGAPKG